MTRRLNAVLATFAVALVLTGCGADFGAPRGATKQGQEIFGLWQGSVIAALAVGAFVWALIFFAVMRYRRRRSDPESPGGLGPWDGSAEPSQRQYNLPLEIAYTIVPLIIVAVLFYFTVQTQSEVTKLAANPGVRVEVTAFQWGWSFHYIGTNITITTQGEERPTLTLPTGQTTRVTLMANDVVHNFYVPDFLFKRDATPGFTNTFDLTPIRTGTFLGRCAEFCGLRHAQMLFNVTVVSADDYQRWLTTQGAPQA